MLVKWKMVELMRNAKVIPSYVMGCQRRIMWCQIKLVRKWKRSLYHGEGVAVERDAELEGELEKKVAGR